MNKQKPKILFYIHHHGKGHLSRAQLLIPIIEKFAHVTLIIAQDDFLPAVKCALPERKIVTLPSKWSSSDVGKKRTFDTAFEGVPLSAQSTLRASFFVNHLQKEAYEGFISDVSAELTIYARGAGIPVLMQRHSGDISIDPTQVFAYQCVNALYAPYPRQLEADDYAFFNKTYFLGSLVTSKNNSAHHYNGISIVHSDHEVINAICEALLPIELPITAIGSERSHLHHLDKITYYEKVSDITHSANTDIIFCSGGNNTLCELLAAGKKLIVIPEPRPYEEQTAKAIKLSDINAAVHLPKAELANGENIIKALKASNDIKTDTINDMFDTSSSSQWEQSFENLIREHFL